MGTAANRVRIAGQPAKLATPEEPDATVERVGDVLGLGG